MSTTTSEKPTFFWERRGPDETGHAAHDLGPALAALRRGQGREAGTVPEMWRYYRELGDGELSDELRAEHAALTVFGIHQQGQARRVHVPGRRIGESLRDLRLSGRYSDAAVDSRFTRAATATTALEVAHHLRGLVQQLNAAQVAGFDYTSLWHDLRRWDSAEHVGRVRRRWAGDYFRTTKTTPKN